jgi:hypothetical protein
VCGYLRGVSSRSSRSSLASLEDGVGAHDELNTECLLVDLNAAELLDSLVGLLLVVENQGSRMGKGASRTVVENDPLGASDVRLLEEIL